MTGVPAAAIGRTTGPAAARAGAEQGMALVLVLFLMLLLTTVLVAVVFTSSSDIRTAAAFQRATEADYAAEAGIARALVDLRAFADWSPVLDGTVRSSFVDGGPSGVRVIPGGVFVDLDLELSLATCGVPPPCSDAQRTAVTRARPWGPNNPRWRLFAYGPLASLVPAGGGGAGTYVVVLVGDDPAESDGNPDRDERGAAPGAGVLRLVAAAFGPAAAHRSVQALVARAGPGAGVRVIRWHRLIGPP